MSPQKLTPELVEAIQGDLMRSMTDDVDVPIEVSADGLVSVKMDARFTVTQVSIMGVSLGTQELAGLEQATLSCVNGAIREVTRRNSDRLAEAIQRLGGPGRS